MECRLYAPLRTFRVEKAGTTIEQQISDKFGRGIAQLHDFAHQYRMNNSKSVRDRRERQQLMRLAMSARDFRHALSAATFLIEECDWKKRYRNEEMRRFHCYETTMVVSYGRPFAQSRGQVAPPFNWKMTPEMKLDSEEELLHDQLITFRNKLHAHSDSDYTKMNLEIWRTPLPDGRVHDFLAVHGGESLNFQEQEVSRIHNMLWKIRHHVDSALQNHPASREDFPVISIRTDDSSTSRLGE